MSEIEFKCAPDDEASARIIYKLKSYRILLIPRTGDKKEIIDIEGERSYA